MRFKRRKDISELLNILNRQGNANQKSSVIPSYTYHMVRSKTLKTAYTGEDEELGKHSSSAGEHLYSNSGNQSRCF